jgi:enoyl-CoA hydratase/carnithine racemase
MSDPSSNSMQDVVVTERPHEHVALVRLNRPKVLNALSNELDGPARRRARDCRRLTA